MDKATRQNALCQPGATPELLDEYERLISEFFLFDPDLITVDEELTRQGRLQELQQILFPGEALKLSPIKA